MHAAVARAAHSIDYLNTCWPELVAIGPAGRPVNKKDNARPRFDTQGGGECSSDGGPDILPYIRPYMVDLGLTSLTMPVWVKPNLNGLDPIPHRTAPHRTAPHCPVIMMINDDHGPNNERLISWLFNYCCCCCLLPAKWTIIMTSLLLWCCDARSSRLVKSRQIVSADSSILIECWACRRLLTTKAATHAGGYPVVP